MPNPMTAEFIFGYRGQEKGGGAAGAEAYLETARARLTKLRTLFPGGADLEHGRGQVVLEVDDRRDQDFPSGT